jgi:hypothetical protein
VGTPYIVFPSTKSDMVTTRLEVNKGHWNGCDIQDEGNSNDPQLALLNERMEQMAKSNEDLANMNVILQARIPKHSRATMENREARNTHTGEPHEEEGPKSSRVEETEEMQVCREPILVDLPPPQTDVERAMYSMINRLEQWCNVLTEAIHSNNKGKASLVKNLLQNTASPFTEEVANFLLPEKFKVPDVPFYTGL